jgi:hypothetical protein
MFFTHHLNKKHNTEKMRDSITLVLICIGILFCFVLFYYFIHRRLEKLSTQNNALQQHVIYQQKIIEHHDRILTEKLGVRSEMTAINSPPLETTTHATTTTSPSVAQFSNPLFHMASSTIPLAPMVGSLLNMFQQQIHSEAEDDLNQDEYIQISPLSKEEVEKELSQELAELEDVTKDVKTGNQEVVSETSVDANVATT